MIHKGPALTVSPMLKERLDAEPKIHVLCNEEVEDVGGDELLSEIVLKNTKTGEETVLHADEEDGFFGLFGFTGKKTTGMFDGVLDMEGGYIKTDRVYAHQRPRRVCRRRRAGDPPASGGDSLRRRRHRRHAVLQVYQRSEVIFERSSLLCWI